MFMLPMSHGTAMVMGAFTAASWHIARRLPDDRLLP
jgi:hypothetical protein